MKLPFYIAKRYLFSKKSTNAINIISLISMIGISVGSMALIIVLSVFNGFENLVISLMNSFTPDIQITVKQGKTFDPSSIDLDQLKKIPGVIHYSEVLEENALLKYRDNQYVATIKGVSSNYIKATQFDTVLIAGKAILKENGINYGLLGYGVYYALSINNEDEFAPISISIPRRDHKFKGGIPNPEKAFNKELIYPGGVFSIQQSIDEKYILVPIDFARKLLDKPTAVSAIEVIASHDHSIEQVQANIKSLVGDKFKVKNRYQQNELIYRVMKTEKWAVYAILTFILIIAAFNIIGSLTMLIIEKRKDISILSSMGASKKQIQQVFLIEGVFISLCGLTLGFLISITLLLLQQNFGLIKLEGISSFIIDAYPVKMKLLDFVLVAFTVILIGFLAAWYPSTKSTKEIVLPSS
ncbi:MAG: ABC transporter permease [Bacteroidia bacterium]|nr:ABC transporter permease [Bacteroidia bacterium]